MYSIAIVALSLHDHKDGGGAYERALIKLFNSVICFQN